MRSIIAAALLSGASLAQAGTFTVDMTTSGLQLLDLTPSDGMAPTLSIDPGGSSIDDWKKPMHLGGEFWKDYRTGIWSIALHSTGTLGAHSAFEWSGDIDYNGTLSYLPFGGGSSGFYEERVWGDGVVHAETSNPYSSIFQGDLPIANFSSFDVVHEKSGLGLQVRNDSDAPATFDLQMSIDFYPASDFTRPVPEPSSYLLLLGGLALAPLARRKRRTDLGH